jgi:hypothetical protein
MRSGVGDRTPASISRISYYCQQGRNHEEIRFPHEQAKIGSKKSRIMDTGMAIKSGRGAGPDWAGARYRRATSTMSPTTLTR